LSELTFEDSTRMQHRCCDRDGPNSERSTRSWETTLLKVRLLKSSIDMMISIKSEWRSRSNRDTRCFDICIPDFGKHRKMETL
jgi:hypothetical protein